MPMGVYGFRPTKIQMKKGAKKMGFTTRKPIEDNNRNDANWGHVPYYTLEFDGARIEQITYNIGKHIMKEYQLGLRKLRTEQQITEYTEKFKAQWFNKETGRTSLLFDNISRTGDGMLSEMIKGLKGKLTPQMQNKFDLMSGLLKEISKDASMMTDFYNALTEEFGDLGYKYQKYNENFGDLAQSDIKELEGTIDTIIATAMKTLATY